MNRKVVSFEALAALVRAQMALMPECEGCICGPVKWRKPDGDGCNWILSRLEGSRSLGCLDGLVPTLDSLRSGFNVPEPARRFCRITHSGAARNVVPIPRSSADLASAMIDDLLRAARAATRESQSVLRHQARTLPHTLQQCRQARQAVVASLRLLGRDAAAQAGGSAASD